MAIPEGARSVSYSIHAYSLQEGTDAHADFSVEFPYDDNLKGPVHAAAEAGANAIAASLEQAFPHATVFRNRSYDCQVAGDPWPPTEPVEEPPPTDPPIEGGGS